MGNLDQPLRRPQRATAAGQKQEGSCGTYFLGGPGARLVQTLLLVTGAQRWEGAAFLLQLLSTLHLSLGDRGHRGVVLRLYKGSGEKQKLSPSGLLF